MQAVAECREKVNDSMKRAEDSDNFCQMIQLVVFFIALLCPQDLVGFCRRLFCIRRKRKLV